MLGFCITRKHNGWTHERKACLYVHFKQMFQAAWLVQRKRTRVGPSAESKLTLSPSKLVKVLSKIKSDIKLNEIDHMPNWNKKRERFQQCLNDYTYASCCKCNFCIGFNKNRN